MAIGPSKKCKWVGNKARAMPCRHRVGNCEVKRSRFGAMFFWMIVLTVEEHLQSKRAVLHGDFQCVNQEEDQVWSYA